MPPRKRRQLPAARRRRPPPPLTLRVADVDHLLMEILVLLPAKSLSRFKCVSKKWLSLISSDHLCRQHTLRRPKLQPSILFSVSQPTSSKKFFYLNPSITINGDGEKKMIPYSLSVRDYNILQACNGLMLVELKHRYPTTKGCLTSSYYVHNPTTRQSREILSTYNKSPYVASIGLAFDPSKSPYYKIVCIWAFEDDSETYYQIEVYDSESHTWKLTVEPFRDETRNFCTFGTYWNSAIYWRFECGSYNRYDIGKNELKTFFYPQTPDFDGTKYDFLDAYLQESDGHLYHFEYFIKQRMLRKYNREEHNKELVMLSVWEFVGEEYDCRWIFKDHHQLHYTEDRHPYYILRSMGESGSGDETGCLLTHRAGKMMAYRFLDKSYEDLLDLTIQPWYKPYSSVQYFQFGEVLALV